MKPIISPIKSFQDEVVDSIISGDLSTFKKFHFTNGINLRLSPSKKLKPIPKYNREQKYVDLKGPTILMFAILCEQDEIVEYILETKNPDLSIKVEGFNCLHLAALVKSPKCLQLLLQHEWIQENIDLPFESVEYQKIKDGKTTALHFIACNKRYANAILILDHYPKPRWSYKKETTITETIESPSEQPAEKDDEDIPERHPNINQISKSGLTPLHIAVSFRDYKMVKILLSFKADPLIPCNDKTSIQLAEELKKKNDERKAKIKIKKIDEIDEIDEIVATFQNIETEENSDTLDSLKKKFAPELLDNNDLSEEGEEDVKDLTELLIQIKNQIEEIGEKLSKK